MRAPHATGATPMIDYPAAHSMDTEWFAVDADGNIGLFDSGEGGAVPNHSEQIRSGVQNLSLGSIDGLFGEWSLENSHRLVDLKIPSKAIFKGLGLDWENLDLDEIDELNITSILPRTYNENPIASVTGISSTNLNVARLYTNSHWFVVPTNNEERLIETLDLLQKS